MQGLIQQLQEIRCTRETR